MYIKEELHKQAIEILSSNGRCPSNTVCSNCVYKFMTGSVINCNPDTAILQAEKFKRRKTNKS